MASTRVEERQAFTRTYSPIREEEQRQGNSQSHVASMEVDDAVSPTWCCCFQFGGGGRRGNQESKSLLRENSIDGDYLQKESWAVEQLKRMKEFSEVVAGPKWKNFIRKIGKYGKPKKFDRTEYMYSPTSYALNFDDTRLEGEEEDDLFVTFSSRFSASAAPLSTDKQRPPATVATSL